MHGVCTFLACKTGFEDCDKNPSNGCEINTTTDSNNCGACGKVCENLDGCRWGTCQVCVTSSGTKAICGTIEDDKNKIFCGICDEGYVCNVNPNGNLGDKCLKVCDKYCFTGKDDWGKIYTCPSKCTAEYGKKCLQTFLGEPYKTGLCLDVCKASIGVALCGIHKDDKGKSVNCDECPSGLVCDSIGKCDMDPCVKDEQGKKISCGVITMQNGGTINCGTCPKYKIDAQGKEDKCMPGSCDAATKLCKCTPKDCGTKLCDPVDGKCKKPACSKDSDCGNGGLIGNLFCKIQYIQGIFQKYKKYTCNNPGTVNSSCTNKAIDYLIKDCSFNAVCSAGKCVKIACFDNNDCKNSGYRGDPFCWAGGVYQYYNAYTCNNPGTFKSSCDIETEARSIKDCKISEDCFRGQCIDENHCCMCAYQDHPECDKFNQEVDWKDPKNISSGGKYSSTPSTIQEACKNFSDSSWSTPDCTWVEGQGCMSRFKNFCLLEQKKNGSPCKVFQIFSNFNTAEKNATYIENFLKTQKCSSMDYYENMHGTSNDDCAILGQKIKACMECVSGNCSIYKLSCSTFQKSSQVNALAKSIQKNLCSKKDYTTVIKINAQQGVASETCRSDETLYVTCRNITTSYINCNDLPAFCFKEKETLLCSDYSGSIYNGEKKYICCTNLTFGFGDNWMPYEKNPTCDICLNFDGTKKECGFYFGSSGKVYCSSKDGKCSSGKKCIRNKCVSVCPKDSCGSAIDDNYKTIYCGDCKKGKKCVKDDVRKGNCVLACMDIECGDKAIDDANNEITCPNKGKCANVNKTCDIFGKCADPCIFSSGRAECGVEKDEYGGSVACGNCAEGKWCVGQDFPTYNTMVLSLDEISVLKKCLDKCKINNDIYCGEIKDASGKTYQCGDCSASQNCGVDHKCHVAISVLPPNLLEQLKNQIASLLDIMSRFFSKK